MNTKNLPNWLDLGVVTQFPDGSVTEVTLDKLKLAVTHKQGEFGVISSVCNHIGGPLGKGRMDGDYVVCPWHYYKFHRLNGKGEPGFEDDCVPSHACKVDNGHLWVNPIPATQRRKLPHTPHALARKVQRSDGPIRVVGISTTVMTAGEPRYSTSEALLEEALKGAAAQGAETRYLKLNDLRFRACEGYYSKSARACTWPCSITLLDEKDQMEQVYEAIVHWADVVLVATPIRWGAASSLYYKMAERMNCIQNYITTHKRVLIQNKVAAFIVTGGQDNIQAVAGQMLGFFSELGFAVPPFPYIAHSLGWTAENMERNVQHVRQNDELHQAAQALAARAIDTAQRLIGTTPEPLAMGGRKAHPMRSNEKV